MNSVSLLFPNSTGNSKDVSRFGVNHNHSRLCRFPILIFGHTNRCAVIFLNDLLNFSIHRHIDMQPTRVEKMRSRRTAHTIFLCKIRNHVFYHHINVPRVGTAIALFLYVDNSIGRKRRLKSIFRQIALLVHFSKNEVATRAIVFGVPDRIVVAWIVGNGNDGCTFRRCQIRNIFRKIMLRCSRNAIALIRKMHYIKVEFQNLRFVKLAFQVARPQNFLHFAFPCRCILTREIFDKLLCQCRTSKMPISAQKIVYNSGTSAIPIHSAMLEKAFVFYGNHGINHCLRYFLVRDIDGLLSHPNVICNRLALARSIGAVAKVVDIELWGARLCTKCG